MTDGINKFWQRYEKGIEYIDRKSLVTRTNRNWNFYAGNQWEGLQTAGESMPFLNFIKPMIKHKVSTVAQNSMVANFSDAEGREDLEPVYQKLSQLFSQSWERANMDIGQWEHMKESAVTGDGIEYYGTFDVADVQRIPCTNILYGDESEPDEQKQPYIIIWQRLSLNEVRETARKNNIPEDEISQIVADDNETSKLIGNKEEVGEGGKETQQKVTVIIHMEKKDGIVWVAKATKNVIYDLERPLQTSRADGKEGRGMSLYPIIKTSWEDFPNSARGLSEVEQLIPNQLEINKTLARRSLIIKLTAYPRIIYNPNTVLNPELLDEVGAPIEASTGDSQSVSQAISYMNPATSNNDPKNYADDLLSFTQELGGSGETAMGNINPNRVAASAIIAIRDQAALPLNEQVAKVKESVEKRAKVWIEMQLVGNPKGISGVSKEIDPATGEEIDVPFEITQAELEQIKPIIRIDVSQDNPWTKEAMQNWLDGVLEKQHITFEEYVECSPENGIIPKHTIQKILAKRRQQNELRQIQESQNPQEPVPPEMVDAQISQEMSQ